MPVAAPHPARIWRDPVLIAFAVLGVVVLGAALLDLGSVRSQALTCWLSMPVLDFLLFWMARRVHRAPDLDAPGRRFWRALSLAGLLFLAGDLVQCATLLSDPGADVLAFHPAQTVASFAGVLLVCAVGLMHPAGGWSRQRRLRLLLDAGIVNSASAVVAWCLVTRPGLASAGEDAYYTVVFGCALLLGAVFLAVRVWLSGTGPMVTGAAMMVIGATVLQAVVTAVGPTSGTSRPHVQIALAFLPCILSTAAPRVQWLRVQQLRVQQSRAQQLPSNAFPTRREGRLDDAREGRRYTALPYTGTVICAGALVITLTTDGLGLPAWGALIGLIVNVALVIARQMLALTENNRLLDRLDESLAEIQRREQLMASLLRHSSEIMSITRADGRFTYVSPAVERLLGLPIAHVLGSSALEILHPDDRARLKPELEVLYATPGAELTYQGRYRHADTRWRWLEVITVNLSHEPGIGGVVGNARDITEWRELHERLRYQAGHDELTGLANRRQFTAAMHTAAMHTATMHTAAMHTASSTPTAAATTATATAVGEPGSSEPAPSRDLAVLLIDLNGFKQINDSYGHATGDAVLRHVAALMRACAGPDDVPARLGGDEFAIMLGSGDLADAERMAADIRALLTEPCDAGGRFLTVGASIGVAAGPGSDPDHLLNAADLRMYDEKQRSRAYVS